MNNQSNLKEQVMKHRFQNLQQFGAYLVKEEYTEAPGDEMNISQGMAVAKEVIRLVGHMGGQSACAIFNKKYSAGNYTVGATELTSEQMHRLCDILDKMFSWEWKLFFPWSKSRKNYKNLKILCTMYGYKL